VDIKLKKNKIRLKAMDLQEKLRRKSLKERKKERTRYKP